MSYDLDLYYPPCECCGRTDTSYVTQWNYTSNVSGMWDLAGAPFRDWNGKPVSEVVGLLEQAIQNLEADPATYKAMNALNGWGTYENLVPALKELLEQFRAHPRALVRVSF